ncbi:MAG: hypothetical protein WCA77_01935 [Thermoplasmata archaeon]
MARWRGSSEHLDRELTTLEAVLATRLRRYARDLAELEREMRDLRKERVRRRAQEEVPAWSASPRTESETSARASD